NGTPRVATYAMYVPGGSWDAADNGVYTMRMIPSLLRDISGNQATTPPEFYTALGTFTVAIPDTTPPLVEIAELSTDIANPTQEGSTILTVSGSASDPESGINSQSFRFTLNHWNGSVWEGWQDLGTGSAIQTLGPLTQGLYAL